MTMNAAHYRTKLFTPERVEFSDVEAWVEGCWSAPVVDASGEFVSPNEWKYDRYKTNPVLLDNHNLGPMFGKPPVAMAQHPNGEMAIWSDEKGCYGRFYFDKSDARSMDMYSRYRKKTMRGFSPGFIPNQIRNTYRNGRSVKQLHDCNLMEISCVGVPCNGAALAYRVKYFLPEMASQAPAKSPTAVYLDLVAMSKSVNPRRGA